MIFAVLSTAALVASVYFGYVVYMLVAAIVWLLAIARFFTVQIHECIPCYQMARRFEEFMDRRINLLWAVVIPVTALSAALLSVFVMVQKYEQTGSLPVREVPVSKHRQVTDVRISYIGKNVTTCGSLDLNLWHWGFLDCDTKFVVERRTITIPNGTATLVGFESVGKQDDRLVFTQHIKGTAEIEPADRAVLTLTYEGAANAIVLDLGKIL